MSLSPLRCVKATGALRVGRLENLVTRAMVHAQKFCSVSTFIEEKQLKKIVFSLVAAFVFSVSAHATQDGDRKAKNAPAFMAAIHELKAEAPIAYKLIMKKVEAGATIQEIRDYIHKK